MSQEQQCPTGFEPYGDDSACISLPDIIKCPGVTCTREQEGQTCRIGPEHGGPYCCKNNKWTIGACNDHGPFTCALRGNLTLNRCHCPKGFATEGDDGSACRNKDDTTEACWLWMSDYAYETDDIVYSCKDKLKEGGPFGSPFALHANIIARKKT